MTAKLIGCGRAPRFRGATKESITDQVVAWLRQRYDETGDDAWTEADAEWIAGASGTFHVSIEA